MLSERLAAGQTVLSAWSGIPDALTVEALASTDFDAVTLDMQHGGHTEDSILRGLKPILAANKPGIVRVPVGRFDTASRALDFGADAVIAPMINSIEDARAFAASVKYPPVGMRSWGAGYAMTRREKNDAGDWLATANADTLAFAMIETREAFAIAKDILAVPGIDGVFVGPSDFSIAWSNGAVIDHTLEDMMGAIADIASFAQNAGKYAAIYVVDAPMVSRYVAMGYRYIAVGSDHAFIKAGSSAFLTAAKDSMK